MARGKTNNCKRQANWNRSKFDNHKLRPILYKHGFKVKDVVSVECDDLDSRITISLGEQFHGSIVSVISPKQEGEFDDWYGFDTI